MNPELIVSKDGAQLVRHVVNVVDPAVGRASAITRLQEPA